MSKFPLKTMKAKMIAAVLIAMSVSVVAAAQRSRSQMIYGTWRLESLTPVYPANPSASDKAKGQKIADEETKEFGPGFTFMKKSVLLIGTKKYSWMLDARGETLHIGMGGKELPAAGITDISEHKMVFTRPDEGVSMTYVLVR